MTITTEKDRSFSRQVLRYTILFLITAVCTYALFIVLPRTFLSNAEGNIDGIAQQYPIYTEIKRMIHALISGAGWESWSWDLGLGDDAFIEFNTRLFNPLTYIVIAFPQKYLDFGFTLMILVSQYLCGLSFMLFGRKAGFDYRQNIMAGLCYAFSGWMIQSILRQGTFLYAAILFPLLILGAEKLLRSESPLPFILAVAAHVLYSIQWAYVGAIAVIIYFVLRLVQDGSGKDPGAILRKTGLFIACGITGILVPGIVLVENMAKMLSTTTSSTVEEQILYPLAKYLAMPSGFFQTTPTTEAYTVLGIPVMCLILLPLAVKGIRQKKANAMMTALLLILSLLPVTGKVFNGFSYSVGRWYYVLVFFMIWSAAEQFTEENFRDSRNIKTMRIWILALAVWSLAICWFVLGIITTAEAVSVLLCACLGLMLIKVLSNDGLAKGRKHGLLITAMMIMGIIIYVNTNLFPGLGEQIHTLCQIGRIESDFAISTQRVGPELQAEDTDFYRIDQVDGYTDTRIARVRANENIYFGNRSVYTYLSTMESSWHEFAQATGNNAGYFDRTTYFSNDNREGLDLLTGVKYFLGDSPDMKPGADDYAAYGFTKDGEIDGIHILKNKYCIGLGTSYDSYITESELMDYAPLEREQVMLQTAVVTDEDADKLSGVRHASAEEIKTDVKQIEVGLSGFDGIDADTGKDGGTLTVYSGKGGKGNFEIELPEIRNARVMLAFEGFERAKSDMDTDLELRGRGFGKNALSHFVKAVSYEDNEKFKIEVTKGDVVKAAQMRKGKNQGYSDVRDFYINLGYFDEISGKVSVNIDRAGVYSYDSIKAYIVPMDIYEEAAPVLEDRSFKIANFKGGTVTGEMTAAEDSVMYFSVLNQPGWKIYSDGEELPLLSDVDIAFTGAVLPTGTHRIELRYSTPYKIPGGLMTAAGILITILITVTYTKNQRNKEKER